MKLKKRRYLMVILCMSMLTVLFGILLDKYIRTDINGLELLSKLMRYSGVSTISLKNINTDETVSVSQEDSKEDAMMKFRRGEYSLKDQGEPSKEQKEDLVLYKGAIKHMFFHPLIAYNERAFDGDSMSKGYDEWFVTVKEFNAIIESVYKKGYILVDINSIYKKTIANGKVSVKRNGLYLPRGKKPLIISIDDLNYYDYMIKNGNVFKLILDKNGEIATYSVTPEGKVNISRDNEIIPLLDTFVTNHPDFSLGGAKGCIALTGFQGVLGYRTNKTNSSNFEKEKNQALAVIKRLKETGWCFASHSYGHINFPSVSYQRVVSDSDKWEKEVEALTGKTDIFIYPYGGSVKESDKKFRYLQQKGFMVFCGVGPTYLKFDASAVIMDRLHIDGIALKNQRERYLELFDAKRVVDAARPKEHLELAGNKTKLQAR